jgi:hypothetical protein
MPLVGADHHDHVAPLLLRHRFHDHQIAEVRDESIEDPPTQIRVRHLAPAEHDRHLDLVPRLEEPGDVTLLRRVVVRVDLGSELDLFQSGARLLLPRFLLPDVTFVLELAVVHDPTHGWIGLRRDLDEIEIQLPRLADGFTRIHHADLLAVGSDQTDPWSPDPVVDPWIRGDPASPPMTNEHRQLRRCMATTTRGGVRGV